MGILDVLKQYANPASPPTGDVAGHFETVAQQANPEDLGSGIAAALRSNATPSFGETIGNLFGQSNPLQKAGVLNELIQALGPGGLTTAGGGILGRILGNIGGNAAIPLTPAQASQISSADLNTIASTAAQHDGSIIDRLGQFYAHHPMLVKSLGVAAMSAVMSHMSSRQSS